MLNKKRLFSITNFLILASVLALLVYVFTSSEKSPTKKEQVVNNLTYLALKQVHYSPKSFNDKTSEQIFYETLNSFDPGKRFFVESDIKQLEVYKYLLDDLIKNNNFSFLDIIINIYEKRYKEIKGFYKTILDTPFDFDKNEYIELDPKKLSYPKDTNELKERWRKIFKYETLTRLNAYLNRQEKKREKNDTVKVKTLEELEEQARNEVLKQYKNWFEFRDKLNRNDWFALYINSITRVFDPHTEYMPPKIKEDFDIYMSGKLEGIGATLQYKDGEIKVVKIIPGGAAWRQGELETGDIILKVAQEGEEPVSIVGWRLDDAVRLIRGPKGTTVHLTVRKVDGSIKEISIVRDVIIIEETYARSAVLSHPKSNKCFGYLYFPNFYADFNKPQGRRVYKDIKIELEKLEQENINGLIIDLRNNGGGSLDDVVKIAGFFIKKGPIVQVRDRKGNVKVFEDPDPEILYKGPMVILVNELSASASEIFAAAMQDYNRAIIMGSKHTFGKGTVQNIMNYDMFVTDKSLKPLGALKITIQKFYRINGGSTQLKGVNADIIFPDQYMYLKTGERQEDYALPWDKITPANYNLWTPQYNLEKIVQQSQKRIKQDSIFKIITDYAHSLKLSRDNTKIPLQLKSFRDYQTKLRKRNKAFNNLKKAKKNIKIDILKADQIKFKTDTIAKVRYEAWIKNLQKDLELPEAINVLEDITRK